jgi:hypothetical protein
MRHIWTDTDAVRSGGLEMLFSNQKRHVISIPATKDNGKPVNIEFLVDYLVKNLMKDPRKELFVLDNQVYGMSLTLLPQLPAHISTCPSPLLR